MGRVVLLGGLALVWGCRPQGVRTVEDGTCRRDEERRLCFVAEPDQPVELRVGDARIVPGECVAMPVDKGEVVRVAVFDGRTPAQAGPSSLVRLGAGQRTEVVLEAKGRLRVRDRTRCEARPRSGG